MQAISSECLLSHRLVVFFAGFFALHTSHTHIVIHNSVFTYTYSHDSFNFSFLSVIKRFVILALEFVLAT
jgi:hypothetical protein